MIEIRQFDNKYYIVKPYKNKEGFYYYLLNNGTWTNRGTEYLKPINGYYESLKEVGEALIKLKNNETVNPELLQKTIGDLKERFTYGGLAISWEPKGWIVSFVSEEKAYQVYNENINEALKEITTKIN